MFGFSKPKPLGQELVIVDQRTGKRYSYEQLLEGHNRRIAAAYNRINGLEETLRQVVHKLEALENAQGMPGSAISAPFIDRRMEVDDEEDERAPRPRVALRRR